MEGVEEEGGGLRGLRPLARSRSGSVSGSGSRSSSSSDGDESEGPPTNWLDPGLESTRREYSDARLLQAADVDTAFTRLDAVHGLKLRPLPGSSSAPSLYRALRRLADGYPDPKTGAMTAISSAINAEFVQIYLSRPAEQTVENQPSRATSQHAR